MAVVEQNIAQLGFGDQASVRRASAIAVVGGLPPVDVALLDPPYDFDEWDALLTSVPARAVVLESDRPIAPGPGWEILKEKRYAGTVVVIANRAVSTPAGEPSRSETTEEDGPDMTRCHLSQARSILCTSAIVDVVDGRRPAVRRCRSWWRCSTPPRPAASSSSRSAKSLARRDFCRPPAATSSTASARGAGGARGPPTSVADVIVKGDPEASADLDIEVQMAHTNKAVTGIQTMLVPSEPANSYVRLEPVHP